MTNEPAESPMITPKQLDHFTECGEPMTPIAGVILARAMGTHPQTMDDRYVSELAEACCDDQAVAIGERGLTQEVIAAAQEAMALDVVPTESQRRILAALAALPAPACLSKKPT